MSGRKRLWSRFGLSPGFARLVAGVLAAAMACAQLSPVVYETRDQQAIRHAPTAITGSQGPGEPLDPSPTVLGNPVWGLFVEREPTAGSGDRTFTVETRTVSAQLNRAGVAVFATGGIWPGLVDTRPMPPGATDLANTPPAARAPAGLYISFPGSADVGPVGLGMADPQIRRVSQDETTTAALRAFEGAVYRGLYPGIDLVFEKSVQGLKYRIDLSPGGEMDAFLMDFGGAESVAIESDGSLSIAAPRGLMRDAAPMGKQGLDAVPCRYLDRGGTRVGIECPAREEGKPLSIDPLITSEWVSGSDADLAFSVRPLDDGTLLFTGYTYSPDFPTTPGVIQGPHGGQIDAFVAKADGAGRLLWATFLGGNKDDYGYAVEAGMQGRIYVTGYTESPDFPLLRPGIDRAVNGTIGRGDVFVVGLSSSGQTLLFTTLIGGEDFEEPRSLVSSANGSLFVCGRTRTQAFPTTSGAFQAGHGGGIIDAFVARLASNGTVEHVSLVGGSGEESCTSVRVAADGNVWIAGMTDSPNFPLKGPGQGAPQMGSQDGYLGELSPDLSSRGDGVQVGGRGDDELTGIGFGANSTVIAIGNARSSDFEPAPTEGPPHSGGASDAVVLAFDPVQRRLSWCRFFGGAGDDYATSLSVGNDGSLLVGGYSSSSQLNHTDGAALFAYQGGAFDGFVLYFEQGLGAPSYSTFLGGSGGDHVRSVAWKGPGEAWVVGHSNSTDFPRAGTETAPPVLRGRSDSFVVAIGLAPSAPTLHVTVAPAAIALAAGQKAMVKASVLSTNGYAGLATAFSVGASPLLTTPHCNAAGKILPASCDVEIVVPEGTPVGKYNLTLSFAAGGATADSVLEVSVTEGQAFPLDAFLLVAIVGVAIAAWFVRSRRR